MSEPTQGQLRSWARSQGIAVGDRGRLPATVRSAYAAAHADPAISSPQPATAPADGPGVLAAGLRGFLDAVDTEVRAVSALSQHIDDLVAALNGLRGEQATRLAALDDLRAASTDPKLSAFLSAVITPRAAQVPEVVPARLA